MALGKIIVKMDLDEISFLRRVGQRIREIREDRRLTQQQVADQSGLHRTFIGAVERGERNLSLLNLRIISKTLRVSLAELLSGK